MYNLPNILTISRIAVIPLIFISVYLPWGWYGYFTAILFIAASITDYLDGYFARLYNLTSAFGRLLDPIADKLLVASALVVILAKADAGMITCKLTFIPIFVILCREILVSGLREFLREVNVGMPVTRLAKWKTGFQMTALSMMLFRGLWYWGGIGEILLWIAGILTFITGYQYFQKSLDYVKGREKPRAPIAVKVEKSAKVATEKQVETEKKAEKVESKKTASVKTRKKAKAAEKPAKPAKKAEKKVKKAVKKTTKKTVKKA